MPAPILTSHPSPERPSARKRLNHGTAEEWGQHGAIAGVVSTQDFSIRVLRDPAELEWLAEDLAQLSASCAEPNVFYEPWMLLPALKAFGKDKTFLFVLVFLDRDGKGAHLYGFFPFEIVEQVRGIALRKARLWSYLYFHWCSPLLRSGYEQECLEAFFAWAASTGSPCSLFEFGFLSVDSPLSEGLIDLANRKGFPAYATDLHSRAVLYQPGSLQEAGCALAGRRLKEFRRLERRLAEQGALACEQLTDENAVEEWIEGFLDLEASGWKGRCGTALACTEAGREFFSNAVRSAFRQGQLMMLRLRLNDRVLAYKCNFLSGRGAFAFKIAYDEEYGRFSPGVLLELENIRRFRNLTGVEWMDSCASADHFMANRLWGGRRTLHTIWIATGGRQSRLRLWLLAGRKSLKNSLKSLLSKPVVRSTQ